MTDAPIDPTAPPRAGEELDREVLGALLARSLGLVGEVDVAQFPAGHSNLTYLVRIGADQLVLRRPPFGAHAKGGHDMGREFRILSKIHAVYPLAPEPLVHVAEPDSPLGTEFYVMRRIEGTILRNSVPDSADASPAAMRSLSEAFVDNLATIHTLDWRGAGLGELYKGDGYAERQIRGWTGRYAAAQTDDVASMDELGAHLLANIPADRGAQVLHNDYKYDNIVLDPTDLARIIGVLDWEMATVGCPLMDLGSVLGYWVESRDPVALQAGRFGPTQLAGNLTRREIVARYAERTGTDVSGVEFYYVYALYKLAVIVQQIYYRYAKGFTTDARFAGFGQMAELLSQAALDVLADPSLL